MHKLSSLFIVLFFVACASEQPAEQPTAKREPISNKNTQGAEVSEASRHFLEVNGHSVTMLNYVKSSGNDTVIFQFGAPNCYTCGPELQKVAGYLNQSNARNIELISVVPQGDNGSFSDEKIKSWIEDNASGVDFATDRNGSAWKAFSINYDVPEFPTSVVVNKTGSLKAFHGDEELSEAVKYAVSISN